MIILPIALIISYFFQSKINIWKPGRFFVLGAILVIDIIWVLNAIQETMLALFAPVVIAAGCIPASMLLQMQNGPMSKTMETCVNAFDSSLRLNYGAAISFWG